VEIVFDQDVPTETSNHAVLINKIGTANPDAVAQMGYPANDIAFLRNLQDTAPSSSSCSASIRVREPSSS
jgi:branched-chain amino acid transport system substrate-binding protein